MPLEHLVLADRSDRARFERGGAPEYVITNARVALIGNVPYDALGYPHVVELHWPDGARDLVFANDIGRIAGRAGEYVANSHDHEDMPPSGGQEEGRKKASALGAQHVMHGHGSVEIPKGK